MHAQGWVRSVVVPGVLAVLATVATADPAVKPAEIKDKSRPVVLTDPQGGVYVIFRGSDSQVFYGPNSKTLYEQHVISSGSDGDNWSYGSWAPRVAYGSHLGEIEERDKVIKKSCGEKEEVKLTELSGDRAKAILDKSAFMTSAIIRVPHLLARDDSGVYYYVDRIAKAYGGKGYRVFVGRKGAMKQMPLTDVASDSAGDVFSTKTGDLRLVRNSETNKDTTVWVKGEKRTELVFLDVDVNSVVIFKDLGIYTFLGTFCDNV